MITTQPRSRQRRGSRPTLLSRLPAAAATAVISAMFTAGCGGGGSKVPVSLDVLTTLVNFNGANGQNPVGALLSDGQGNLYGTTGGGNSGNGTLFRYNIAGGSSTTLVSFDGTTSSAPSTLIDDGYGHLYGTTLQSDNGVTDRGTLFEYTISGGAFATLAKFTGPNGGAPSSLVLDARGNVDGTTDVGGPQSEGTLFQYNPASGALTTVASFGGTNGSQPASLVTDGQGNLYGVTVAGGANGDGTLWRFH